MRSNLVNERKDPGTVSDISKGFKNDNYYFHYLPDHSFLASKIFSSFHIFSTFIFFQYQNVCVLKYISSPPKWIHGKI